MSLDAPTVAMLNDKNKFSKWAAEKGLRVPKSFAITSKEQLFDYNPRCGAVIGALALLGYDEVPTQSKYH